MSENNKSRAYNLVVKIHAQRVDKKRGLVSDCDCIHDFRAGLIQVGPKCAQYRIEFLNREKRTPGHTHKSRACTKNRERRKYLRSFLAHSGKPGSAEYNSYSSELALLTSEEYVQQRKVRGQYRLAA